MKYILTFLFLCCLTGVQAQNTYKSGWGGNMDRVRGNGELVTRERETRDFDGVETCCGLRVELTKGNQHAVRVAAESNVQEYVLTEVTGGRLEVRLKKNLNLKTKEDIVIYVTMPDLTYAGASSAGDLICMSAFSGKDLELEASSGGNVKVEFTGSRVRAKASSGGDIELSGSGETIRADASSGGDVKAKNFAAQEGDADASSGGGVSVRVSDKLKVDASSGGGVKYYGSPAEIDSDRSSGGSVRKAGM